MEAFKFSLNRVRNYKSQVLDKEKKVLGALQHKRDEILDRIHALETYRVEKATELGCARILPVQTEFTNAQRIRQDRLQAHALEAAEQCLGTYVPEVADLVALRRLMAGWDPARRVLWADESLVGAAEALAGLPPGPWAILIGPEGGFSEAERGWLRELPFVVPVSLGPRILRADTAACAAITLWQAALGDWR